MTPLARSGARPWRLGARTRKGVLVVHIASAGAWIGIDVAMAVLVFTALLAKNDTTRALCFRALELFAVWPLLTTGLICLASGVVLGLGTKWGLVRYWWVAIKLALNMLLTTLVLVALRPGVMEAGVTNLTFDDRHIGAAGGELELQSRIYEIAADRYEVFIAGGANNLSIEQW